MSFYPYKNDSMLMEQIREKMNFNTDHNRSSSNLKQSESKTNLMSEEDRVHYKRYKKFQKLLTSKTNVFFLWT
jgi:hypothetical protein